MNILDKIVKDKIEEVKKRKSLYPLELLEQSILFNTPVVSLKEYLLRKDKSGIIAEFKRQSPSKGAINQYASPEEVSIAYMQAGASALSVLTDKTYFGGTCDDLRTVRKFNFCPILRKDFIIDEYQIIESKSIGADAILLIAAILDEQQIKAYTSLAKSVGLEVLNEVHNKEDLRKIDLKDAKIIGVNNRDLKTFTTDIIRSKELSKLIPNEHIKISESGINNPESIIELRDYGYKGFLIGEKFMKTANPSTLR